MRHIYFSICTRSSKTPKSLPKLLDWAYPYRVQLSYDAPSYWEGHQSNLDKLNKQYELHDNDIIILCHDDIQILETHESFKSSILPCLGENIGFLGVAGATRFDQSLQGVWWNARHTQESRGFVFQGANRRTAVPNWFGNFGQVIVLDGLFLAIQYKKLKEIGLTQPSYLDSGWDFYDIHLTLESHYKGYNNFAVPILIMHESPGVMRPEWNLSREKFLKYHLHSGRMSGRLSVQHTEYLPCLNTY